MIVTNGKNPKDMMESKTRLCFPYGSSSEEEIENVERDKTVK
jgi:hypothetical protein